MFVVRVPVLSLQITVVHPNVSTEGRDLTMAFKRAILLVPRAKHLKEKNKQMLYEVCFNEELSIALRPTSMVQ